MRKLTAILLALVLVLSLAAPAAAAGGTLSEDIVILYTNDVHTYIDGDLSYDVIAGIKDYLQTQYENVLLVDAGDHIQGTAYGSMDKGQTIIELMNAAGYDLATLGNHEFDYGMEGRINVTDNWAAFPYVSCNFYNELNGVRGDNVLDSYKIFDLGAEKVAIIGITTPESFTKSTPAYFQDGNGNYIYGISGGEDGAALYADVQAAIDEAEAAGATKVIALGHLGDDLSSQPWTSEETIANVSGLDAFIDGHSHSTVEGKELQGADGNPVWLTQTGEYFDAIGMMVIDADTGAITTELLDPSSDIVAASTADEAVATIKNDWIAEVNDALGVKIGSAEVTLDNYDSEGNRLVRLQETNSGSFAADALYYLFDDMGLDVDVAIMNGGGVRNGAITGDLTYLTLKQIHTFGNVACLQTVTGQQILDALEWGARQTPYEQVGGFLHVAGLRYFVDSDIESTVQYDEYGVWTGGPTGEYRVCYVEIFDKDLNEYVPLDLDATYNMAGYNYTLRDLGDGFAMFDGAVNVVDYVMEDYMVLANYVQGFPNAVVGAFNSPLNEKYPELYIDYSNVTGDGRIYVSEPTWQPENGYVGDLYITGAPEKITAGQTPAQVTLELETENVTITGTKWVDSEYNAFTGNFVEGNVYYLEIAVEVDEGYGLYDWHWAQVQKTEYDYYYPDVNVTEGTKAVMYVRYSLLKKLDKVEITFANPTVGQAPDMPKVPQDAKYDIENAYWYEIMNYDDVTAFENGKKYMLNISLQADEGYEFAEDATIFINGEESFNGYTDEDYGNVSYTASFMTPIDRVDITFPTPAIGLTPDLADIEIPEDAKYTIDFAQWFDSNGQMEGAFGKDRYNLELSLLANEGYEFAEKVKVYINGVETDNFYSREYETALMVYYSISFRDVINKIEIPALPTVNVGDQAELVQLETPEGANYTIHGGQWMICEAMLSLDDFDGSFADKSVYYLLVMATPNTGYEFAEDAQILIGGQEFKGITMVGDDYAQLFKLYSFGLTVVDKLDITVGTPENGKEPGEIKAPEDAIYEITEGVWAAGDTDNVDEAETMEEGDTFAYGKYYWISAAIELKEGYVFADGAEITINGKASDSELYKGIFGFNPIMGTTAIVAGDFGQLTEPAPEPVPEPAPEPEPEQPTPPPADVPDTGDMSVVLWAVAGISSLLSLGAAAVTKKRG